MNKQELVAAMADKSGLSKADNEKFVKAFEETAKEVLGKGESIQLIGFGTLSVSERPAKTGRNPQTGKEMQIAAKNVVKFKPGKALDETLN